MLAQNSEPHCLPARAGVPHASQAAPITCPALDLRESVASLPARAAWAPLRCPLRAGPPPASLSPPPRQALPGLQRGCSLLAQPQPPPGMDPGLFPSGQRQPPLGGGRQLECWEGREGAS